MSDTDRFFAKSNDPDGDQRSALIRAKAKARGRVPNACPFGCPDGELDQHGYCKHLVGWTVPGDDRHFHARRPQTDRNGKIVLGEFYVDGTTLEDVLPADQLEKGTVSSRVYRPDPADEQQEPKKKVKAA